MASKAKQGCDGFKIEVLSTDPHLDHEKLNIEVFGVVLLGLVRSSILFILFAFIAFS